MELFLHSNLKFFREKYDLSQEQLADLIEKKKSVIGHYERGTSLPPLDSLVRISTFFGVTLDNLTLIDLRRQDEFIIKFINLAYNKLNDFIREPEIPYEAEVPDIDDVSKPPEERIETLKEQLKTEREKRISIEKNLKKLTYLQSEIMRRFDDLYYSRMK